MKKARPVPQNQQFKLAFLVFLFFHFGLLLELVFIGHYESFWQLFPLIFLSLGIVSLFLSARSLIIVKVVYLLTIVSGILGVILHLKSNWEFEVEMYPTLSALELCSKSLTGAIPALAPSILVPIGLMGFLLIQLKIKE